MAQTLTGPTDIRTVTRSLLVQRRGWTAERYGSWLAKSWELMLLGPGKVTSR